MTLSRKILRKIDDRMRSEFDRKKGEWMAKVPISGATKAVWQRYCQAVAVGMGEGVAILIRHELASVADEDLETLGDRLKARQADLDERESAVADTTDELKRQQQELDVREARLKQRERDVQERETSVEMVERQITQELKSGAPVQASTRKLGRNEPCWCNSGKKYKYCHGAV
jgi:hypothetical protein